MVPRTVEQGATVVVGRTWQVLPTIIVDRSDDNDALRDLGRELADDLRRHDFTAAPGWASHDPHIAFAPDIRVECDDPGEAVSFVYDNVTAALSRFGITHELQEIIVLPAWRDERDWRLTS